MWSGQAITSVSHTIGMGGGCWNNTLKSRDTRVHHCLSLLGRIVPSRVPSSIPGGPSWACGSVVHHGRSLTASICVPPLLPAL